jgi:glycine/D-amino acid oxidase-like deaminating enzyme
MMHREIKDVVIVGGGNIGSALAYGLAGMDLSVALLDQGDTAFRAAFGNFGLVWFQGKGLDMPRYAEWSLEATERWPAFAQRLEHDSAVRIDYHKPGGLMVCRSETDFEDRLQKLKMLASQSKSGRYDCEMIDRSALEKLMPRMKLGPAICGASFSPHDGHVNTLFLIRALHAAFRNYGGAYFPGQAVETIQHDGKRFRIQTRDILFDAAKVVLAAGVGIPALASQLGIEIPVRPQRGQIIVTERLRPVLPLPISGIRQTAEGSFMFGVTNEEVGLDTSVTFDGLKRIASKAIQVFPDLAGVRMQRCWAALRPLAPDQFPIYHHSRRCPGAYVLTSHSGVTLAPLYADTMARWIVDAIEPRGFESFSLRRFDV